MILNQSGFEARAVYSGERALDWREFEPDMLISDVIMADLNGIDAAIRIRDFAEDQDSAFLRPGGYGRSAGKGARQGL
jgi:DNA-binding response OmpR family regulator